MLECWWTFFWHYLFDIPIKVFQNKGRDYNSMIDDDTEWRKTHRNTFRIFLSLFLHLLVMHFGNLNKCFRILLGKSSTQRNSKVFYALILIIQNSNSRDNTGGITFGDFMEFLSVLSKGSTQDKIFWSFRFYDVNKDGIISRDELTKVANIK